MKKLLFLSILAFSAGYMNASTTTTTVTVTKTKPNDPNTSNFATPPATGGSTDTAGSKYTS